MAADNNCQQASGYVVVVVVAVHVGSVKNWRSILRGVGGAVKIRELREPLQG